MRSHYSSPAALSKNRNTLGREGCSKSVYQLTADDGRSSNLRTHFPANDKSVEVVYGPKDTVEFSPERASDMRKPLTLDDLL